MELYRKVHCQLSQFHCRKKGEIVRTIERIYFVSKHDKIEIKYLLRSSWIRSVNKPISVGIVPESSFPAIAIEGKLEGKLEASNKSVLF